MLELAKALVVGELVALVKLLFLLLSLFAGATAQKDSEEEGTNDLAVVVVPVGKAAVAAVDD